MDKIYLAAYALIALTLVRAITANKASEGADAATEKAIHATDKMLLVPMVLAFLATTAIIIVLR